MNKNMQLTTNEIGTESGVVRIMFGSPECVTDAGTLIQIGATPAEDKVRDYYHVVVSDPIAAISWLISHCYEDCLHVSVPRVDKAKVAKLLRAGIAVPGCKLIAGRADNH